MLNYYLLIQEMFPGNLLQKWYAMVIVPYVAEL